MIGIEEVNKGLDNVTQMGYKNILIYPCIQELRFQVKMGNGFQTPTTTSTHQLENIYKRKG